MPRYFFHIRKGSELELDEEGVEFDSAEAAQSDALIAAREILLEKALSGQRVTDETFEIADEGGNIIARIPFIPE